MHRATTGAIHVAGLLALALVGSGCNGASRGPAAGASASSASAISSAADAPPSAAPAAGAAPAPAPAASPGGAGALEDGTLQHPFVIPGEPRVPAFRDGRDTRDATSSILDVYPGFEHLDESGPEFFYSLRLTRRTRVRARLAPEPSGTDVDLHLLASVAPTVLVARGHREVTAVLDPGDYLLVADTFVAGGAPKVGRYDLTVELEAWRAGTLADPLAPGGDASAPLPLPFAYADARDTRQATSRAFDTYPGLTALDLRGPEQVYRFTVAEPARLAATIAFAEPAGTDVDLLLLSDAAPGALVARGDTALTATLAPGAYTLVVDTKVAGGVEQAGPYELRLSVRARRPAASPRFNDYVLAAVDFLYAEHRLQGYGSAVLTHDIAYGRQGAIAATGGARTMCVAAVMEVLLTAMTFWAEDRGDDRVFDYLPIESWQTLRPSHIKAHLWVNHSLGSGGTADALRNFRMGEVVPFEQLRPGSFVNLNRTNRTGHAVVLLAFVDRQGREHAAWNPDVIGFRYFSAQGGEAVGAGGLDFRVAVFAGNPDPPTRDRLDRGVILSANQRYLNTGEAWSPDRWGTQ